MEEASEEASEEVRLRGKQQQHPPRNFNKHNNIATTQSPLTDPRPTNDNDMIQELTLKINDNSNIKPGTSTKQFSHWNHLYQLGGSSLHRQNATKGNEQQNTTENTSESPSGIRTKILSSPGFSQFLVRNNLKGKGVVFRCNDTRVTRTEKCTEKSSHEVLPDLNAKVSSSALDSDGILLREWLKPGCKVNKDECLRIFKQIVEIVAGAHSRQIALKYIRPSCFNLSPSNQVRYVGSLTERELFESVNGQHSSHKRLFKEGLRPSGVFNAKQQKLVKNTNLNRKQRQSSAGFGYKGEAAKGLDLNKLGPSDSAYDTTQQHNMSSEYVRQNKLDLQCEVTKTQSQFAVLEDKWYTSPEEPVTKEHSLSSDIYCLGVLLFELFCCYESWDVHVEAMLDLRYRILPPKFLSEYPKEAGFCLWLLHPEPSSRPRARDILHSQLICGSREVSEGQLSLPVDEDHTESELLLHFLLSLEELKHKHASKLVEDIGGIEADIEEVGRRHLQRTTEVLPWTHKDPLDTQNIQIKEPAPSQAKLMKNMNQLESTYFSMRSQIQPLDTDGTSRSDKDLLKSRESWSRAQNKEDDYKPTDHLGDFFDGLCKYARYTKFELRGTLKNGDLLNSSNVICALGFDRDEEYIAAAGISKKIKIFEFNALLNDSIDVHYPVVEMTSKSKLSYVCWNTYIKNYLAATDYDGVVQLWDASTGQCFSQYADHEKRAWSVDFSSVDPTKFASGSDDCSVKLWSITERKCISTIRSFANVCSVQFSADSPHLLAFGSADYRTYCYDLRHTRNPWCTLSGHGKAVSYVKFVDSETIISTSTDNTLKLWDLNKTSSSGLSTNACSLTFRGHTNEKNFVGLSVSDGYIACGSESNEVYAYHRSLPMPITSHKFGSANRTSGLENGEESGQFVSSVCWKGKSDMVIAANSTGSIKLLQMT